MNKALAVSLLKGTGLLALAVLLVWCFQYLPETTSLARWADALVRNTAPWSEVLFVLACGLLSCVFVPRQGMAFAAGFVFGPVWGTALVTAGTSLGCALALFGARAVGREALEKRYADKMCRWNKMVRKAPFLAALAMRLFPSGSNLLFSLMAGVSRVQAGAFICGSALGYVPQNLVFCLLGSGARVAPELQTAAAVLLFAVATGLGIYIFFKIR